MKKNLEKLKKDLHLALEKVVSPAQLEKVRVQFLGRKGEMAELRQGLKNLPEKDKKHFGRLFNQSKEKIEHEFAKKQSDFNKNNWDHIKETERLDVTEPRLPLHKSGHEHPLTTTQKQLEDIARGMGFMILDGPELEGDFYNFEGLNIPENHPARDTQDTFYIKGHEDWVMRTHTSPVQVRAMHKYGAPLRAIVPGRCFRNEATDASHEHTFHQLEGLMIDKNISIAHVVAVMKEFLKGVFGKDVKVRLRPGYFPFVEPGFELDMECLICGAKGCSVCKKTGWVEVLPCGLVHPNVIKSGGLDPKKWTGFAFGMGLTRIAMMRYEIDDIRLMMSGDVRFLNQF